MRNILLGVTGSVAAVKIAKMITALRALGNVEIVATKAGKFFIDRAKVGDCGSYYDVIDSCKIHLDEHEWVDGYNLGDPVAHIELRKWADIMVIAPLDANTLAKITHGICDNMLTCVVRAWDWEKPMILCPAMNTFMWDNCPTLDHIKAMKLRGAGILYPVEKTLACGDVGVGAMCDINDIAERVELELEELQKWRFPLLQCNGIPLNHHPGAFGFQRRKNHHTGVDLYCEDGSTVYAVEDGTVVKVALFTGPRVGHEWWEETYGLMVEGATGVVNYGEVHEPSLKVGDVVKRGQAIAKVKRVLFLDRFRPDIPGHSCSMLHFELYKHGTREFADWHDPQKNPALCDPTPFLMAADFAPPTHLTWGNEEAKVVG